LANINPGSLDGLWWLLLLLAPFLFLQRQLHREIQSVFLLLTRRTDISLALFSLFFFPGVLLHESSHYIIARLLGVRTGGFSLLPKPLTDGRLQLGYVETVKTDFLRDALIGVAPLITGGLFVAYAGMSRLGLPSLWDSLSSGGQRTIADAITQLSKLPDFWLWFYLIFTISSTMMPSPSDRRAWLPVVLVIAALIGVGLLAGAGPWMMEHMSEPLNTALRSVSVVFAISLAVHIFLIFPFFFTRRILEHISGQTIV
jgi:hypothetical protein